MKQVNDVTPVIKWAGGKRQLVPTIMDMMPESYNTYFEPFFGGGAVFCALQPEKAIINDFNVQLINMYKWIKKKPGDVMKELSLLQDEYNSQVTIEAKDAYYYQVREKYNEQIRSEADSPYTASLLIFLNKAGFNGLYRVSASGNYNVPPAHRNTLKTYEEQNINGLSKLLKNVTIKQGDFEKACKKAHAGDFVFFDSPYYDTFDTYQAGGFSEADHKRLYNLFDQLSKKGVKCMLTNNDCDFIKDLYKNYNIKVVEVKRMINCNGKNRKGKEVIITNY